MKHKLSITLTLLTLFLITQFIGLLVINAYNTSDVPYGMQQPRDLGAAPSLISIIVSFAIAIALIMILIRYRWKFVIRTWFFVVIALSLGITLNALLKNYFVYASIIALIIALIFAALKLFKPTVIIHNLTEVLIYPGIAAVFVPILTPLTIVLLLIIISIYDMWAVWHSGVMQKMAKFQMEELKIFGGLLIPKMSDKDKAKLKDIRKLKTERAKTKAMKDQKLKVSLAILGGGDIVFPIITAGVFLRAFSLASALFVTFGALAGLTFLLIISKKKFYPAMPFISAGIFLGMLLSKILL